MSLSLYSFIMGQWTVVEKHFEILEIAGGLPLLSSRTPPPIILGCPRWLEYLLRNALH